MSKRGRFVAPVAVLSFQTFTYCCRCARTGVSGHAYSGRAWDSANVTEMTQQPAALEQPTPVAEIERGADFVREHLVWFLGLLPLLIACLRVLVASGGNTETLKALVQSLNVTALVLATLLPFASTVIVWALFVSALSKKRRSAANIKKGSGNIIGKWFAFIAAALMVWFTMPINYVVANISAVVVIVLFAIVSGLASRISKILVGLTGIGVLVLLVLAPFVVAGIWLPSEHIKIKAETRDGSVIRPESLQAGFVLSSDEVWTKYMDWDKRVHIVRSDDVLERQIDDIERSWWHRSLGDLTS